MTKFELSRRVLDLLNYDSDEIIDQIFKLAREIELDDEDEEE